MNKILGYAIWAMKIISFVGIAYVPIAFLTRKKLSPLRQIAHFLFLSWMIVVLYVTVFGSVVWGITVFKPGKIPANINPFPTIIESSNNPGRIVGQLLENMLMFMPVGFLMPIVFKSTRKAAQSFYSIVLFTTIIEVSQYLLGTRSADMADIIMNTFGGIIGYIIFLAFNYILKNKSWWKSLCKSYDLPYPSQPQKVISIGKMAVVYSGILVLALGSSVFFTYLNNLKTSSYSQMNIDSDKQKPNSKLYEIESKNNYNMEIYQPTEEDFQIDQKLQEIRDRNIESNQQMLEDAKKKGIRMPEGAMISSSPPDILGYSVERPSFEESQLRQIYQSYEDYILTRPNYFEPYDANRYVSAGRSFDPRINTLLYGPNIDHSNGIFKDYQSENLYAMEAIKKTGEYTTIVLGKVLINDKWIVIFEGDYYELRSKVF